MNERRRKYMCIVQPGGLSSKRVVYSKRRKVRNAAEKIEWIAGGVSIELIFKKRLVTGRQPPVEANPDCIRGRVQLAYGTIVLHRTVEDIRRRIQTCESQTVRAEPVPWYAVSIKRESSLWIDDRIGNRGEV